MMMVLLVMMVMVMLVMIVMVIEANLVPCWGGRRPWVDQQFLCSLSNVSHLGGWMVITEMMMMTMMVVKIMMEPTCPWTALRRTVSQVRTVWSKLTKWLSSQVAPPGILTVMGCMARMSPIPGSFYSNLSEFSLHEPISTFKVIQTFAEICKTDMTKKEYSQVSDQPSSNKDLSATSPWDNKL